MLVGLAVLGSEEPEVAENWECERSSQRVLVVLVADFVVSLVLQPAVPIAAVLLLLGGFKGVERVTARLKPTGNSER